MTAIIGNDGGAVTERQPLAKVSTSRLVGSGVPVLPWAVREYGEYGEYEGHAFVTADPKGLARSVCDGFIDDMAWVVALHNAVLSDGWRSRLARRLLKVTLAAPMKEADRG